MSEVQADQQDGGQRRWRRRTVDPIYREAHHKPLKEREIREIRVCLDCHLADCVGVQNRWCPLTGHREEKGTPLWRR